jgi:putative ATPase
VTPLMGKMGYGKGYKYAHNYPGHVVKQQYLPDSLKGKRYYNPSDQGYEQQVADQLRAWLKSIGPAKEPKRKHTD